MSRKHYIRLARIIKDNKLYTNNSTRKVLKHDNFILDLCDMLKQDNSLFDKERFIDACE